MSTTTRTSAATVRRPLWQTIVRWLVSLLLLVVIGGGIYFYTLTSKQTNSAPFQATMNFLQNSPAVQAALGQSITNQSWLPLGSFSETAEQGDATMSFQIKGSKSTAEVSANAQKQQGKWSPKTIKLTVPSDGEALNKSLNQELQELTGRDTPKFDPNAKVEPIITPMLPPPPTDIQFDIPELPMNK